MGGFFHQFGNHLPNIGDGLLVTLELTVLGSILALIISFVLGLMALSRYVVVRGVSRTIVEFFRGTSLVVQMFWLAFALPILGFKLEAFVAALIALALNYGAYGSEVVRGAINAVPKAQWEATIALNMTRFQRMWRVILPQARVGMIPPFNNLLIQLLKGTPIAALILVFDLFYQMKQLRNATGNTAAVYVAVLIIYFIVAYAFTLLMNALEAWSKRRIGQGGPRRSLFRPPVPDPTGQAIAPEAGVGEGL